LAIFLFFGQVFKVLLSTLDDATDSKVCIYIPNN